MITYNSLNEINNKPPVALSIGTFDGLHLAHRQIIDTVKKYSHKNNIKSSLLSFNSHPIFTLKPNNSFKLLTTLKEKQQALDSLGLDILTLLAFDEKLASLSATEFIKQLIHYLDIKLIVMGPNHFFGKNKQGDFSLLTELAYRYNFTVCRVNGFLLADQLVSSTKIRQLLAEGEIKTANRLLGYSYSFEGKVIYGEQLGRKIGFPTSNLSVSSEKLIPKDACYVVFVMVYNRLYKGMMYIGNRPTLNGRTHNVEVNIFDFDEDIYHQSIRVYVMDYLRADIRFAGLEQLVRQLHIDKQVSQKLLCSNPIFL